MRVLFLALFFLLGSSAWSQSLSVATFNVESDDDTDPALVATDFARIPPIHVWALQEVESQEALDLFVATLRESSGFNYVGHMGTTGGRYDDYLAYIYIADAFQSVEFSELEEVGGSRHPLLLTGTLWTGQPILMVNNHFNRGDENTRQGQARRLRDWIQENEDEAIIALGDFNFDYDFRGARQAGNRAFGIFARGGHASWPQPMCVAGDNCPITGTQCNPNYRSILDFVFLGGIAKEWNAISDMAFIGENYCRREASGYADHRPVLAQIQLPGAD